MKYLIYIFSLLLLSCNYLDKDPDASLNVPLDSEEKIAELLTGAYPDASYFPFLETRTDNVAERENGVHTRLNEAMYRWEDEDQEDLDAPLFYWNSCYRGIAQANKALELLARYPKSERVKALYGEAFLLRAYLHFMLVNIWAEPYKGEASKNDMGIPYLTTPEKNALVQYSRGTVYEVYQRIEEDLRLGITLVSDAYYAKPKFHFNKRAAYAFASRFYLFKGEWQTVIDYANYVLTQPKTQLRHWKKDYYDVYGFNNRPYLYQRYTQPEEEANLLITTVQSRWARELPTAKYGFTTQLMTNSAAYYTPATSPTPVYNGMYIAKFDELSLFGSTGSKPTDLYVSNVLLTTDEVMLNRMEAYAMLKNYNQLLLEYREYQKIKFDNTRNITVEDLIASTDDDYRNYSPFYGLSIRQLGAIKNIAFLRQWEFIHEGMRWLDIRRFYTPVNRTSEPLQKEDLRKVIQLPIEAINRGLPANPR